MCPQGENGTAVNVSYVMLLPRVYGRIILLFVLLLCSLSSVLCVCVFVLDEKYDFMEYQTQVGGVECLHICMFHELHLLCLIIIAFL